MSGTEEEVCRAAWVVIGLEILLPGEALEGVWDMGTARNNALRLLASLKAEAERVAAEEGTTMNQFINVAVAEKLAALRTERYFRERASRADLAASTASSGKPHPDRHPMNMARRRAAQATTSPRGAEPHAVGARRRSLARRLDRHRSADSLFFLFGRKEESAVAVNIKSAEADRLARELAAATGESITTAVTVALEERLARLRHAPSGAREAELEAIWESASRSPPVDSRSDDEILGYNEHGTFD